MRVSVNLYTRLRRIVPWVGLLGASVIGAIFLWFAFRRVDWRHVWEILAHAQLRYLVAALGLFAIALVLRGIRWRLLFRKIPISTVDLVLVETTAIGVNSISPIPVLDEPTRIGLLIMRGVPAGTVLATMAAMRSFELAVQAMIGAVGLLLLEPLRSLAPFFIAAAVLAALALLGLFSIGPLLRYVPFLARLRIVRDFSIGVQIMRQAPMLTALSFLMTGAYAFFIGMAGWMLAQSVGIQMSMPALVIVSLTVIFFTDWIPGLPGAIGTFEFVALYLMGLFPGFDKSMALGYAILLHILFFVPPLIVAALYLPYAGFRTVDALMELFRPKTKNGNARSIVPQSQE